MKTRKLVRDAWRVLSGKFVRHQELPNGCTFVLIYSGGRKARNDMTFTRKLFAGKADDKQTVSSLIQNYLEKALLVDISDRRLRIKLFAPDGKEIKGNTLVGNVRKLGPTPDDVKKEQRHEAEVGPEIDELSKLADMDLRTAEEWRTDPEEVVLRGFVRAEIARYGKSLFNDAVQRELERT